MNPFEILGLAPTFEVDADDLETRYLRLSRELHPDFNQGLPADEQVAMLTRAAGLNDAYRVLREDWSRAEALVEVLEPGALEATKTLSPMFLMEAMETRESVLEAAAEELPALRKTVESSIAEYRAEVARHLDTGDARAAATAIHQSNYYRKALGELLDRISDA